MANTINVSELPIFDMADHLDSDEAIIEYLNIVLEENDPALFAAALGDISRARGMTQVAEKAGLGRESLYKALRVGSSPRFDTIQRVCAALGIKLTAVSAAAR